tara:strand:- start:15 stop:473 length:459 start_codon:yes stop_codon:yes gene_type:complete
MNKIANYILILFLLLLTNCGYEAVLNNQNYQFSINVNKIKGDQKINALIINSFKQLKENEKKYNLSLTSNKEKLIISKDSKGDPSIFEIKINVNYVVKKDGKILISNKINKKTTYNNIADKFELENYEKNIINNLVSEITDNIKLSISKVSE